MSICENRQNGSEVYVEMQKIERSLDSLNTKKNKVAELTSPNSKTFTKVKRRQERTESLTKNEFWVL